MQMYEKIFAEYGQTVAQILLTKEDLTDRRRYLNARNTLFALLNYGAIPIINENDTVAAEEIKLGDNDTLSAFVAGLADADLLILLTDIDGLYNKNPQEKDAQKIAVVTGIDEELERFAQGAGTKFGTGGMMTKVQAAKMAVSSGIPMIIADGKRVGILREIVSGQNPGTIFIPREVRQGTKKCWLAFCSDSQGIITVDDGAANAILKKGKSLLPAGIVSVEGDFEPGNIVSINTQDSKEIARGFVNYSSAEINLIKGAKTSDILNILHHKDYDEVIHRNNMAVKI